jgi:hypothetical protein
LAGFVIDTGALNEVVEDAMPLTDERKAARQTMIAKFLLPEINSKDNMYSRISYFSRHLEIFLIAEKEDWKALTIELWHRRFNQFATYDVTQLYNAIMRDLHNSFTNFYSK